MKWYAQKCTKPQGRGIRYAILINDMVIGEGITEEAAWDDAEAGPIQDLRPNQLLDLKPTRYNTFTHEVKMLGGIVQLVEK